MTTPDSQFTAEMIDAQIKQAVENALVERDEAHRKEIQALQQQMSGVVQTTIPEHAGGVGTDIAPTWSLAEQKAAWEEANK